MDVTLRIPDDIAAHLTAGGGDLSRRALEAFARRPVIADTGTHKPLPVQRWIAAPPV